MQKLKTYITIWQVFIAVVLALISLTGFIYTDASRHSHNPVLRTFQIESEDGNRFVITDVYLDGEKKDLSLLRKGFHVGHSNMLDESKENEPVVIRASRNSHLSIAFLTGPKYGKIRVTANDHTEMLNLNTVTSSILTYSPNSLNPSLISVVQGRVRDSQSPKLLYAAYFLFCVLALLFCVNRISRTMDAMKKERLKWKQAGLFVVCIFMILFSCLFVMIEFVDIPIVLIILLLALIAIYILKDQKEYFVQYVFLIFASTIGCLMLLLIPPTHILDEYAHFTKAYEISSLGGDSHVQSNPNFPVAGKTFIALPESMRSIENIYYTNIWNTEFRVCAKDYLAQYAIPLNENELKSDLLWYGNTYRQPILAYMPSAGVLFLLRLLNASPLMMFHMGRLINLFIWILIGYYSISIIPRFKRTFLLVMLLPISLQQSFGFNIDWLTNALSFLLVALVFRMAYATRTASTLGWKDAVKLLLAGISLSLCKFGYFPIVFLVFIIPAERFRSKKNELAFKWALAMFICMFSALQFMSTEIVSAYRPGTLAQFVANDSLNYSVSYVVSHPFATVRVYLNTFLSICTDVYHEGLLTGFGWMLKYPNEIIQTALGALYLVFILSSQEDDGYVSSKKEKVVHFLVVAVISALVFTSMFLLYTPRESSVIYGIQPRYFIPIMASLYIMIQNKKIKAHFANPDAAFASLIFFALGIGIWTIAFGYYS